MSNNYQAQADLIHRTLGIPVVAFGLDGGTVYSHGSAGHRSLAAIALEIKSDWEKPYFGAVPYLNALGSLDQITDNYYDDTAEDVVRYFLANATSWRGETARRIKAELNTILKGAK